MRLPTLKNIKHAIKDRSGSEAIEMVYSTFFLMMLILTSMLIIGYALQVNQVSYAAKRVARYVEVSGQAHQTDIDALLRELLPNAQKIGAKVSIENVDWFNGTQRTIQLRDGFTVKVTANYDVVLANPSSGNVMGFSIPITAYVNGQSEIFWKDS